MKNLLLVLLLIVLSQRAFAQSTNDLLVGASLDFIKTDIEEIFAKGQVGLEVNYFATRDLSISAGAELWTADNSSFAFGARYYLNNQLFFRGRALIGDNDFAIGAGWVKPVFTDFRFEATGDFYFEGNLALRAGLAYVIHATR